LLLGLDGVARACPDPRRLAALTEHLDAHIRALFAEALDGKGVHLGISAFDMVAGEAKVRMEHRASIGNGDDDRGR
jgi:hypothetical protein